MSKQCKNINKYTRLIYHALSTVSLSIYFIFVLSLGQSREIYHMNGNRSDFVRQNPEKKEMKIATTNFRQHRYNQRIQKQDIIPLQSSTERHGTHRCTQVPQIK
jgi:hypothetical protein